MRRMPRDEELDRVLRGRKSSIMHDRRAARGGARNMYMDYIDEYEQDLVSCENCKSQIPFNNSKVVNIEGKYEYYCNTDCILMAMMNSGDSSYD